MTDFLIKSSACALVLLLAYHLFLEREKMHRFNRFFLLFAVGFSLVIPFIMIEIEGEVVSTATAILQMPLAPQQFSPTIEETDYTPLILWILYAIGFCIFSSRFIANLIKIIRKQQSAKTFPYKNATLALVPEITLPHTFAHTIFINETDYNNRNIEDELYLHELTHVTQKHTIDVLFIEIVKTVFWFNPIFLFYKKAIQLNHEFLADEKVIETNNNVPFYQRLLLSKANYQTISLASSLNYALTKKRLVMMGKNTSKSNAVLRKLMLLPILSALFFCMCTKEVERQKTTTAKSNETTEIDKNRDAYFAGVMVHIVDKNKNITLNKPYEQLTLEQKRKYMLYFSMPQQKKMPTAGEFNDFKNAEKYELSINGKGVSNTTLEQYKPEDIAYFETLAVPAKGRTKRYPQPFQASIYTHDYFEKEFKNENRKFGAKKYSMTFDENDGRKSEDILRAGKKTAIANNGNNTDENTVYTTTDQAAVPQNGFQDWYANIMKQYKIPSGFEGKGRIVVQFIVEKNGTLSNFKILRQAGNETGNEAVRVLKLSEKWKPAKLKDNTVRALYTLPIMIETTK